jgi:ferredoxin, 2Fe-2S
MARIVYVQADGTRHAVEVACGRSLMEGAVKNGVPGILAECGGSCSCGTCRVFIEAAWQDRTGKRSSLEEATLDLQENDPPNIRLSCQIQIGPELDGMVVHMPKSQV